MPSPYDTLIRTPNPYQPRSARIVRITPLVKDNVLFQFRFEDEEFSREFSYKPGQFVELSIFGVGECPISISSSPTRKGFLELCVRRAGRVTNALYQLKENDLVGIRGPYGNGFPVAAMENKNLLLIAGGLGMAPIRSLLNYALDNRSDFHDVILMYGARDPGEVLFRNELETIRHRDDIKCLLTVDEASSEWDGYTGVVTELFKEVKLDAAATYAAVCGPPIVYKFVLKELLAQGFSKNHILMSLERKMKCGVGKCGHCSIGYKYTCIDGPIFTYWDAMNLRELI